MATKQELSKQERTYLILRERILSGVYGPGHRLVIAALARELDVSPMPVREAIRRLEAERWVVYRRNQGAEVAPADERSWAQAMTTLALLEGYATALTAPHMRKADIARLRRVDAQMGAAIDEVDVERFGERNRAFHAVIYDRCPNSYLRAQIDLALERLSTLRNTIFIYVPGRARQSLEEHERLIAMIESGAPAAELELFARNHKLRTVRAYEARRAEAERA